MLLILIRAAQTSLLRGRGRCSSPHGSLPAAASRSSGTRPLLLPTMHREDASYYPVLCIYRRYMFERDTQRPVCLPHAACQLAEPTRGEHLSSPRSVANSSPLSNCFPRVLPPSRHASTRCCCSTLAQAPAARHEEGHLLACPAMANLSS